MKKHPGFIIFCDKLPIMALFLMLFGFSGIAQSNPSLGDVDESGAIDIVDALQVARYYVGAIPGLPATGNADVNGDGAINILDALLIAQYYVGMIDAFPANPTPAPSTDATPTPTAPPGGIPDYSREVPYNEDLTIQAGETLKIDGFDFIFRCSDIADSRCPEDAVCVWEGEAVVTVDCWTDTQYIGTMVIKAPPAEPLYDYVIDPARSYVYRLTCISVDPYPRIETAMYSQVKTATLRWMIAIP
jgi:hypothetical protein